MCVPAVFSRYLLTAKVASCAVVHSLNENHQHKINCEVALQLSSECNFKPVIN